jgi:N-acetylglucosaminyl-diphospho-decaprenol L-rhamnosyltransferase
VAGRDLAIVIVNWNVRDLLLGCLEAAFQALRYAGLRGEIWVVDNASADGSVSAIRERFAGEHDEASGDDRSALYLIASPGNLGFAGGNNLALRAIGFGGVPVPNGVDPQAIGVEMVGYPLPLPESSLRQSLPPFVLLLNPDTQIGERAIAQMMRFMERNPRVGICGPSMVYGDGVFQHAAYRFPSLAQLVLDFWPLNWRLTESWLNGRYPQKRYLAGMPFPIDHPLGATMLFRREVIEQTGGFDLGYHMYVEEIDWCMRVKRAGWHIYCVPQARVVHYHGQSTRQVRPQMRVALWRSRYRLFSRYYAPTYRFVARRIIRAGMRAEIRRAQAAQGRGEVDESTVRAMIDACLQVIEM